MLFWVYILASAPRGMLYIGYTSNLPERMAKHKRADASMHTSKMAARTLVYVESFATKAEAEAA